MFAALYVYFRWQDRRRLRNGIFLVARYLGVVFVGFLVDSLV